MGIESQLCCDAAGRSALRPERTFTLKAGSPASTLNPVSANPASVSAKAAAAARGWRQPLRAGLLIAAAVIAVMGVGVAADRDALWMMVHELCVRDQKASGYPFPCVEVDLSRGDERGVAVFQDIRSSTHLLLIPTRRLSGVEDPLVGTGTLPNYWADAWAARKRVAMNAGKELPREAFGMAINPIATRSQDQLHIHIACVRPNVRDALARHAHEITTRWSVLPVPLAGQIYRVRRLDGEDLKQDPFELVREDARAAGTPMGELTIGIIGSRHRDGKDGFVLLQSHAGGGALAHAEDMLDHRCALARR